MAEIKEKRRGRPPGSKNKVKKEVPELKVRRPWKGQANGVRRTRRTPDRVALAGSIIQVNRKHILLIQKWSKETKIGVQQIFDDIMLAGASAAHKTFYKGLINSRKAAEDLFDAETNTETVVQSHQAGNGLLDRESRQLDVRGGVDEGSRIQESSSLASVGSGRSEETDTNLRELAGIDMASAAATAQESLQELSSAPPDAPQTTTPEEEGLEEEEPEDYDPPY